MDSGVAPHLRGRRWSHIFAPSPPEPALRGPLVRLARGRSRCTSVCVAEQAACVLFYFDVWLKGMVGKDRWARTRQEQMWHVLRLQAQEGM